MILSVFYQKWQAEGGETWQEKDTKLFLSEICHYRLHESHFGSIVYCCWQRVNKSSIPDSNNCGLQENS